MNTKVLNQQKNLIRCLQRIHQLTNAPLTPHTIPALYYTASLLDKYLTQQTNPIKHNYYYDIFQEEFNRFLSINKSEQSLKNIKKNEQDILGEVKEILSKYRHISNNKEDISEVKKRREEQQQKFVQLSLSKIQHFYSQHNLDQAWTQIQILKQHAQRSIYINEKLLNTKWLDKIQQQYQKMLKLYNIFQQIQGWTLQRQQSGIKMQIRIYEQQRTIAVRMKGEINIQILPFLAIACQIDLQKQYIPFVSISQQLKLINNQRNIKVGYSLTSVPLLADRQCHFYAIGYDRMQTSGSIFIFTESIQQDKQLQRRFNVKIEEDKEKIFLKVHYFCLEYRPINKYKAELRIVTKADFKLKFLPLFLLKATASTFTFDYYQNVVKKAKEFKGSKWQERVANNPAMYHFFRQKINKYFP